MVTPLFLGRRLQRGVSMIEVLVTIVILAFGLLGMAGLQARLQVSEMESYQRAQALVLLNDMANRIATNGNSASSYLVAVGSPLGAGTNGGCPGSTSTLAQKDLGEWCNALLGSAEVSGSSKLGAVIGGRGCVESLGNNEYLITIAWQGLVPLTAAPASVACAKDLYDGASGSACRNDLCRRTVTTVVRIASLA